MIRVLFAIAVLAIVMTVGCAKTKTETPSDEVRGKPNLDRAMNTKLVHQPNRFVSGKGHLPGPSIEIDVSDSIRGENWITNHSDSADSSTWGILDAENGSAQFLVARSQNLIGNGVTRIEDANLDSLGVIVNRSAGVDSAQFAESHLEITTLGATMLRYENLPDGMTVLGDGTNVYSFADPTDRYPHGALGDRIEWGSLVAGPVDPVREVDRFILSESEVFEGLFPLLGDIDGDGFTEIVTTVSESNGGARLVAFSYENSKLEIIAESDPVGTGFRWLHQIAVAPFGPNGETEIAVVETPHVGGIAKFYRLIGDRLELVASEAGGYMSHLNGSRNLDQAVAGDFDGDGSVELVVPSRDQETLIALRREGETIEEVWELELGSRLTSNLSVFTTDDGSLTLGAATEDGVLHIWQ